jgi:hypothetical protein
LRRTSLILIGKTFLALAVVVSSSLPPATGNFALYPIL